MATEVNMPKKAIFDGWTLFWMLSGLVLLMSAGLLVTAGVGTDGIRLVIRATARSSLLLFLVAFLASPAATLRAGPAQQWLVRNRRSFGLAFAMSHAIHLLAIVVLARTDPATFALLSTRTSIVAGSAAYVVIGLLAATSFDAMVARLGAMRWKRLHRFGLWFVGLFFLITNGKRVPASAWYLLPVALLIAAAVVRLRARRPRSPAGTPRAVRVG
jgi:DMSO/TMAO reductase YedYZ heme-binding membrane subunit